MREITKRIDINLGYSCNARCTFCYYLEDVKARNKDKDLTTEEARNLIKFLRSCGMKTLEFTGGEPTIRRDLIELAKFAKDKVGFEKLSIITNGINTAEFNYAQRLVEAGIKDYLFSIHGPNAIIHDKVTGVPGSFDKLMKSIDNLKSLGVKIRCNSVVSKATINTAYQTAQLICSKSIPTVNFIMFNPIEQAIKYTEENIVSYSQAATVFKKIADDFGKDFIKLTFRYIPLCLMEGYEKYVQNVHQVHFDHDEWNYLIRAKVREPWWKWFGGIVVGLFLLPSKFYWVKAGISVTLHAAILEAHTFLHKSNPQVCRKCKNVFICGGVWKKYKCVIGTKELHSIPGDKILDADYYIREYLNEAEKLLS